MVQTQLFNFWRCAYENVEIFKGLLQIRVFKKSKPKSGDSGGAEFTSSWPYFKSMKLLLNQMTNRPSNSNLAKSAAPKHSQSTPSEPPDTVVQLHQPQLFRIVALMRILLNMNNKSKKIVMLMLALFPNKLYLKNIVAY